MQTLSAYLLETENLDPTQLESRLNIVRSAIDNWLTSKGANPALAAGEFNSRTEDGGGGFVRSQQIIGESSFEEVSLEEFSRAGQIFTTRVAIVNWNQRLNVYATLSVENSETVIVPIPTNPRCPAIVRTLLSNAPGWYLNGTALAAPTPTKLSGNTGGEELAKMIQQNGRSLPIVVVSEIEDETLWPRLAEELAFDLAGLAQVVRIDDAASWALSDELGKLDSCYKGAVRLYWPPRLLDSGERGFSSSVWTATALLSNDQDGNGLNRLRTTLRRQVMATAALTIQPPVALREFKEAALNRKIAEINTRASAGEEDTEIKQLYLEENQQLKDEIDRLRGELSRANARAEMAEYALGQKDTLSEGTSSEGEGEETARAPVSGEVRFYKKTHAKPAYDVLVAIGDCGHNSWQNSAKADKARKGVERLEGRGDWDSMQHCATCQGGGVWKVRW